MEGAAAAPKPGGESLSSLLDSSALLLASSCILKWMTLNRPSTREEEWAA
jgi:hypothetical protein